MPGPFRPPLLILALVASLCAAEPPAAGRIRVAAISLVPVKLDVAGNADRLERGFREAAAGGARLAVAPEGALEGYIVNDVLAGNIPVERMRDVALPLDHPVIGRFRALARELDLCLVFGFAESVGPDVFNTAVFIDQTGSIRGRYRKMQFAEGYHADWWWNRLGETSRAFDTPFGRCGILICNDRWNPALARIPALDGAQFLVIPAYGSTASSQDREVRARGRETGLPVVQANVGVSLLVNGGEISVVRRENQGVTFGEIEIPPPRAADPAARDSEEAGFLVWREQEMRRRFDAKRHAFPGIARPGG